MKFSFKKPTTKIVPMSRYKMTKDGYFKLDDVSLFRIGLLIGLFLSMTFFTTVDHVAHAMFYQESAVIQLQHQFIKPQAESQTKRIELFIKKNSKNLSDEQIKEYSALACKYAKENKIDPYLLVGLMKVESSFNTYAISDANALGLTQVVPKWHKEKITILKERFGEFDIFKPEHNIALGAMVLNEYIRNHKGSVSKALLNYNGSYGQENASYHIDVLRAKRTVEHFST